MDNHGFGKPWFFASTKVQPTPSDAKISLRDFHRADRLSVARSGGELPELPVNTDVLEQVPGAVKISEAIHDAEDSIMCGTEPKIGPPQPHKTGIN